MIRRREFITPLARWCGGCVAEGGAWAAGGRMRRIGVLMGLAADDPECQARLAAFAQGLQQAGWTVGQERPGRLPLRRRQPRDLAQAGGRFVALAPEVILAHSSAAVAPLLMESRTIPIVFTLVADPVGAGYVESLARPAATSPASPTSNIRSAANGWSCSRRSRRM